MYRTGHVQGKIDFETSMKT